MNHKSLFKSHRRVLKRIDSNLDRDKTKIECFDAKNEPITVWCQGDYCLGEYVNTNGKVEWPDFHKEEIAKI